MQIDLTPARREALARGSARLALRGHRVVSGARVRLEIPLDAAAVRVRGGVRARVASVESFGNGPVVETSSITPPWRESADDFMEIGRTLAGHALVNRRWRETIGLARASSSGSGVALVLPG